MVLPKERSGLGTGLRANVDNRRQGAIAPSALLVSGLRCESPAENWIGTDEFCS